MGSLNKKSHCLLISDSLYGGRGPNKALAGRQTLYIFRATRRKKVQSCTGVEPIPRTKEIPLPDLTKIIRYGGNNPLSPRKALALARRLLRQSL